MIQKVSILATAFGVLHGRRETPPSEPVSRCRRSRRARRSSPRRRPRAARRCTGSRARRATAPTLTGGTRAGADRARVRGELEQSARHARRPLLRRAHDDAAAGVEHVVGAGSRRGVRVHPEDERVSAGPTPLTAASAAAGERAHAREPTARAAPARPAPPAFIAGAAGAAPATSGPDQATLNAARRSRPTGCFTPTTTPARAFRRCRRSTRRLRRASHRRACSRSASATISRPVRSSTTARCT